MPARFGFLYMYIITIIIIIILPLLLLLLLLLYYTSRTRRSQVYRASIESTTMGKRVNTNGDGLIYISRWTGGGGLMTRQRSVRAYCTITHTHLYNIYIYSAPFGPRFAKFRTKRRTRKEYNTYAYRTLARRRPVSNSELFFGIHGPCTEPLTRREAAPLAGRVV